MANNHHICFSKDTDYIHSYMLPSHSLHIYLYIIYINKIVTKVEKKLSA